MWKRLLLALGLLVLLGAVSIVTVIWLITPPPGVTEENAHRLRLGMSEVEVEAIFGGPGEPSGDYDEPKSYMKQWVADDIWIEISFDSTDQRMNGGTMTKLLPSERPGEGRQEIHFLGRHVSIMDRLHRWLDW